MAERHGIFMAREIIACSRRVIVTSEFAARLARIDARDRRSGPDPCGPPCLSRGRRRGAERDEAASWVVRLGQRGQAASLVGAGVSILRQRGRNVGLVFAGPVERSTTVKRSSPRPFAMGSRTRSRSPGILDDARYANVMSRVSLAVQLRAQTNGESSAAMHDCIARRSAARSDEHRRGARAARVRGEGERRGHGRGARLASWANCSTTDRAESHGRGRHLLREARTTSRRRPTWPWRSPISPRLAESAGDVSQAALRPLHSDHTVSGLDGPRPFGSDPAGQRPGQTTEDPFPHAPARTVVPAPSQMVEGHARGALRAMVRLRFDSDSTRTPGPLAPPLVADQRCTTLMRGS